MKAWLDDEKYFTKQKKRALKNDSTQEEEECGKSDESFEQTHTHKK